MAQASKCNRGFTLTEVLIVIGIIIIVLGLAVPALNILSGSRSIEGAENNLSAMLGRVRADAIGIQETQGVFFFLDPATLNVTLAQVRAVDGGNNGRQVHLDLVPDRDFFVLPKGVSAQLVDNAVIDTNGTPANKADDFRDDDGYLGFNQEVVTFDATGRMTAAPNTLLNYGGVILFDGKGQLVSRSYAFRGSKVTVTGVTIPTAIMNLLYTGTLETASTNMDDIAPKTTTVVPNSRPPVIDPIASQFGLSMFEREAFLNNWNLVDAQVTGASFAAAERAEEAWIDQNSTPLMVNRYNGTLLRGE